MSREKIFTLIKLDRLDKKEIGQMIDSIFPKNKFSSGLMSRVFEQSKGNPLFTEELLRVLIGEGFIFRRDGVRPAWYLISIMVIRPRPGGGL